jgi:hypothetical protein
MIGALRQTRRRGRRRGQTTVGTLALVAGVVTLGAVAIQTMGQAFAAKSTTTAGCIDTLSCFPGESGPPSGGGPSPGGPASTPTMGGPGGAAIAAGGAGVSAGAAAPPRPSRATPSLGVALERLGAAQQSHRVLTEEFERAQTTYNGWGTMLSRMFGDRSLSDSRYNAARDAYFASQEALLLAHGDARTARNQLLRERPGASPPPIPDVEIVTPVYKGPTTYSVGVQIGPFIASVSHRWGVGFGGDLGLTGEIPLFQMGLLKGEIILKPTLANPYVGAGVSLGPLGVEGGVTPEGLTGSFGGRWNLGAALGGIRGFVEATPHE